MILPVKPVRLGECMPHRSADQETVLTWQTNEYAHGMTRDGKGRLVAVLHRNLRTGAATIRAQSEAEILVPSGVEA